MVDQSRVVADVVVDRLRAWDVPAVFGFRDEGVEALIGALRRGREPAFVPARHEESAAFMAAGHARHTGAVAVCLATHGPGALHLLTGLYDAKLEGRPMVAIVGQRPLNGLAGVQQEEVELVRLFGDACGQFVQTATNPEEVPALIDRAFRVALATRGPTCLVLPHAVQSAAIHEPVEHVDAVVPAVACVRPARVVPREEDLKAAAEVLGAGRRVAIMIGQGAQGAAEDIPAFADHVGAGVTASLLGKPVLDERLPFHTGVMGRLGTTASALLLAGCDTLLLIGTGDPWTEFYPPPGRARVVQIDIDGRRLAQRYPVDVPLLGDAAETVRALQPLVPRRTNRDWRAMVERWVDRWRLQAIDRAETPAEPLNPQLVMHELSRRLPRDVAVAVDVGSVTYWYARHLQLPPGVRAHVSGTLGSMGTAVPYGIAAKLAGPDKPVVALAGDRAIQMTGLSELITVAHRWPGWADPRFVVLVLSNRDLTDVNGGPGRSRGPAPSTDAELPDIPYAAWARLLGLHGVRVDRPDMVGPAWDEAFAADRPTLIEAIVDPWVPLLPPKVPFEELAAT
jgi:pyruvate dehydrogenase (quinone)